MALSGLLRSLYHLVLYPLAWLARLVVRRHPGRWVLAGCGGDRFADNSAWLYLWLVEHRPDLRPVWITRKPAIARRLRKAGYPVALEWTPRGLVVAARAGAVVLSHGSGDLFHPAVAGAFVANVWHGLPIKHIMLDHPPDLEKARPSSWIGRALQPVRRPGTRRGPDLVYGMTLAGARRVAAAARLAPDQASGAGSPRLQALAKDAPRWPFPDDTAAVAALGSRRSGPLVLFLPTWGTQAELREGLLGPALFRWLDQTDGCLLVKPHPNDPPLQRGAHWTDRVQDAPRSLDATLLIARADVLVTDISSALLDMLAAGRPVVLIPTAWSADRGYYQRPEEFVDGPVVADEATFVAALEKAWRLRKAGRSNASKAASAWLPSDIAGSSARVVADLEERVRHGRGAARATGRRKRA